MKAAFIVLAAFILSTAVNDANAQSATRQIDFELLKSLIGKPEHDPDVQSLQQAGAVSVYSRKQLSDRLPSGKLQQRTTTLYGGEGFLLVVEHECLVDTMGTVTNSRTATVKSVQIICGDCDEAKRLGKWAGALPADVQLPTDPSSLLRLHVEADVDREEIVNVGKLEVSRRRRIYFGGPMPENSGYPYGFIFDSNKLSLLVLLPTRQANVIPPTKPPAN